MPLRGSRLTAGLLAGLVVVVILGTIGAIAISRSQRPTPDSAARTSTSTTLASADAIASAGVDSTLGSRNVGGSGSAAASGTDAATRQSDPLTAPAGPSNNSTVQMSPSVRAHANAGQVAQLMQGYFDAINQHNYSSWSQLVLPSTVRTQGSDAWLQSYATTADSSIWLQEIQDDPVRVTVKFTSEQDPDLAPADLPVHCIDWTLTYRLNTEAGRLVIGPTVAGGVAKQKCS